MELQDLQTTAGLAHLNMDTQELQSALSAFEEMLSFFAAMQAADQDQTAFTASINTHTEGMAASSRLVNAAYFRSDNPISGNSNPNDLSEEILTKAGERDGRFVVIPNVL
jgi:aspartyl-tRNA(Asn)/glutamyl-tRNA(Gln) amidotransferase subunit C